jgi:glycerophosphoryl diester phosphodiesterase
LKSGQADDQRVAARAAQILSGYAGPMALMSFEPALIAAVRRSAPLLTRGLVAEGGSGHLEQGEFFARGRSALAYGRDALRARPQFIAYSVQDLPAALPLAARHLCGMPLLTWTVRSTQDRQRAARWADQMIFEGFRP